ncbi:DUF6319 family protein [Natronoglycomyces albus]|uniref:Uncharacterized protein n=1 Tax=Natronoglycomyces albus TaxID=2811108 RepID=A0A895XX43_9ACTN|nr:DUF6319 family protein [Natronoglycomyces albus]QSB06790.1 hypothetical protein JQS30_07855 [Natronoglycomyces albus]
MVVGLSEADIATVESTLASGKKPRVVFTELAGQVSGRTGKVVELTQPREGDFVVVAFGRDQLPFAADEVRLPQRGELSRRRKSSEPAPVVESVAAPPGPGLLLDDDEPDVPRQRASSVASVVKEDSVSKKGDGVSEVVEPKIKKKSAPRQRAKVKDKHPELTVTLTFHDGAWEVSASRGARKVVAATAVDISVAQKMIHAAEVAEVDAVAEEVLEGVRQKARAEAEALRAQLEAAEARLAQLQ